MPVYNEHVKANRKNGTYGRAEFCEQAVDLTVFAKPADTSDGSILRLCTVPTDFQLTSIQVLTEALTGATSADLGFYGENGGAVINKNILMSAQTLAAASRTIDGMANVSIANMGKTIGELLGYTAANAPAAVDLALTLNTAGSATGNIAVRTHFKRP